MDTVAGTDRAGAIERAEAYSPFLRSAAAAFPDIVDSFADRGSEAAVAATRWR